MWSGKPDRPYGRERGARQRPVLGHGRTSVHHGALRGCALWPVDREPREGGPVQPRPSRRESEDRSGPPHRGADDHERPATHDHQGIPLQIKHVNVTIDREKFTFNPTSCDPLAITGTLASTQGACPPCRSRSRYQLCDARIQTTSHRHDSPGKPPGPTVRACTSSSPTRRHRSPREHREGQG